MSELSLADMDAATRTLFGEARGESPVTQCAVLQVIINRRDWPGGPHWWGRTVEQICKFPFQFSCWNSNDPNYCLVKDLKIDSEEYIKLDNLVKLMFEEAGNDITGGASHYKTVGSDAPWARNRKFVIRGNLEFYRIGPGGGA